MQCPLEVDGGFSLGTGEIQKGDQGDTPLGLPPPLGREGFTFIPFKK
jgi:hypothetical protein